MLNPKTVADHRREIPSKGGPDKETSLVEKFLGRPPSDAAYKSYLVK